MLKSCSRRSLLHLNTYLLIRRRKKFCRRSFQVASGKHCVHERQAVEPQEKEPVTSHMTVYCIGIFGAGPPPVFLCSLRNFESSFFAVLCNFVHFSFSSLTLRCAVPTAFTAIVICSHTLCFILLVFVFVNFDFSID